MHKTKAILTMPKIYSTCVKMNSTCCELHTTQRVTYSNNMELLCINTARAHKTQIKSQCAYWLYTKTKYALRKAATFEEDTLEITA